MGNRVASSWIMAIGDNFHGSPSIQTLEEHGALDKDHIAMGMFDVFQISYSALQREHEAVIGMAADGGAGIVIRGGAAKGAPSEEKQEGSQWARWQQARLDDLLEEMARMEFILRFTFSHPEMDTNIVSTINPTHLQANIRALLKGPLPETI
jgi:aryl-alcohol dehydrogenase-like predicted oxidoreductase